MGSLKLIVFSNMLRMFLKLFVQEILEFVHFKQHVVLGVVVLHQMLHVVLEKDVVFKDLCAKMIYVILKRV